jgi:hypothetical protein
MKNKRRAAIELFLVSFIALFAEIAMIRWVSAEIGIFSYFNNLVLLSCFLGIGCGCYFANKPIRLVIATLALSFLIVIIKQPVFLKIGGRNYHIFRDIPLLLSSFRDSVVCFELHFRSFLTIFLGLLSTSIVFMAILVVFFPLGQCLGRLLNVSGSPIAAYSINIFASIAGIWAFNVLSFASYPPSIWFILIALLIILTTFIMYPTRKIDLIIQVMLLGLIAWSLIFSQGIRKGMQTIWSPYQKLSVYSGSEMHRVLRRTYAYEIAVNNVGHMGLIDLSDGFINSHRGYLSPEARKFSQYDIPYLFKPDAKRALILGAGAGNDAAGALRHRVLEIDAVEIDPEIHRLGIRLHPEKPYADNRVNVIIDDARSFLKKSKDKYDVISFGLLNAHTFSSSYNNIRLDHYIYTIESFREARELLEEDGIMTICLQPERPWVTRRVHRLIEGVFGHAPLVFKVDTDYLYGFGEAMLVISKDPQYVYGVLQRNKRLSQFVSKSSLNFSEKNSVPSIKLTTDNWPYLYIERPGIPTMHVCIIAIVALILLLARRVIFAKGEKLNLHFFFLGAGFLLLEFQNISKISLLFGSTWIANSFIITGIMLLVLLANLTVAKTRAVNIKVIYPSLAASILLVYLIPLDVFNILGFWQKSLLAGIFLNLPIYFAGIIFIYSFKNSRHRGNAFGSNLLGAAGGGLLESLSFIVGINALLLIVLVLYFLSYRFGKRCFS